ncbi:hypothetical protein KCU64_g5728, partial [Aureobasidium melanogenum]
MNTSRSLLALPNELLALIIESTDLAVTDLANLRLTCKHTKHFASSALGRRIFVDLDICYGRDAFDWFTSFLLSDLGSYVRSVCLRWWTPSSRMYYPTKHYRQQELEIKPKYPQLQDITIEYCYIPARLWTKVLCAATQLKTFKFKDPVSGPSWYGVYKYKLERTDTLLNSVNSGCLSKLVLVDLQVSDGILKELLDIHQQTLSALNIRRCTLVDETWLEILNYIRLNLSQLRSFYIDVRYEAAKKTPPPKQESHRPFRRNQYDLKKYSSPIKLKLEGQKEIANGLSEFLKAREGDQA